MLERYFIRPETVDRIRTSWIAEPIERYVEWLSANGYAPRNVLRRVPILVHFGTFAYGRGARSWGELPNQVAPFAHTWAEEHGRKDKSESERHSIENEARNPVEQMLGVVLSSYSAIGRPHKTLPFEGRIPDFFGYLRDERGLTEKSILHYRHELGCFERYLKKIALTDLRDLSPHLLSSFVTEASNHLSTSTLSGLCASLRVFLRYLYREHLIERDLSSTIESPQSYRLSDIPRSITWDQVQRTLEAVDRRTPKGKRDYAILLLLVTYGLRAREVSRLKIEDIDWKRNRLLVAERKAGHCTAYPLSSVVGQAILEYLRHGRPQTEDRRVFFRDVAPRRPLGCDAISQCVSRYLRKAGIDVARPGSHTLRHTCVQRLVDADFPLKTIGDYVGHRSPSSTEVYAKVAIEPLRRVALGDGEEAV